MLVPAEAATLRAGSGSAPRPVASRVDVLHAQSYAVPSTVTVGPSATRDGFTATSPAVWAAQHAAATRVAQSQAVRKSAAITAILAAPVTFVSYGAVVGGGAGAGTAGAAGVAGTASTGTSDPAATGAASPSSSSTSPGSATTGDGSTNVTTTTVGTVADHVAPATLRAASATADEIAAAAVAYVGVVPYVHDGADPATGFDCSGLVMYVYAKFGIRVPHDVDGIAALGTTIAQENAKPGDLVVYAHRHIGIYLGDGYMVDAPNVGRDVEVQAVWGTPTYVHIDRA
jgi:cell wall-associated NlpC family hydrolase